VRSLALWSRLYLLVWLAFAEFLVTPFAEVAPFVVDLHVLVGVAVFALALMNYRSLNKSSAPIRLKRISKAAVMMAALAALLGLPLYASARISVAVPFQWGIGILHLIVALAIITQAASTATAYDMWEEKEFR